MEESDVITPHVNRWRVVAKNKILEKESPNILARSKCCQNVVNKCISRMNMELRLPLLPSQQYVCTVQAEEYLKFLLDWPGLDPDDKSSNPAKQSFQKYLKRSKNWFSLQKAENYGNTLFPFFVHDAEQYILESSEILIENDGEKQKLYKDIVFYQVLARLCGCFVPLHRRTPLFCPRSFKESTKFKEILKSYASDHSEYKKGFPDSKKAEEYFDDKDYDDDGDSDLEADVTPSRTHGREMKRSPRDERDRYFNKRENRMNGRQRIGGADDSIATGTYQFLLDNKLEHRFDKFQEVQLTIAELMKYQKSGDDMKKIGGSIGLTELEQLRLRDGMKKLSSSRKEISNKRKLEEMKLSEQTPIKRRKLGLPSTTSSSVYGGSSNISRDINLPNIAMLNNNIDAHIPMPQLQATNSYAPAQSHATHHGMTSNMQQMQMNLNHPPFQINHMSRMNNNNNNNNSVVSNPYGPAMPPIVDNTNNFSSNAETWECPLCTLLNPLAFTACICSTPKPPSTDNASLQQPILPMMNSQQNNNNINMNNRMNNINSNTVNQPSSLFQNSANENDFGMPATDAITTTIDPMSITNRQQQISDNSDLVSGGSSHHALNSHASQSMYSSVNNVDNNNSNNSNNSNNNNSNSNNNNDNNYYNHNDYNYYSNSNSNNNNYASAVSPNVSLGNSPPVIIQTPIYGHSPGPHLSLSMLCSDNNNNNAVISSPFNPGFGDGSPQSMYSSFNTVNNNNNAVI